MYCVCCAGCVEHDVRDEPSGPVETNSKRCSNVREQHYCDTKLGKFVLYRIANIIASGEKFTKNQNMQLFKFYTWATSTTPTHT